MENFLLWLPIGIKVYEVDRRMGRWKQDLERFIKSGSERIISSLHSVIQLEG